MVSAALSRSYRVGGFDEWRNLARRLLDAEVYPEEVAFFDPEQRQQRLDFEAAEIGVPDTCEIAVDDRQREFLGLRRHIVPTTFLPLARIVAQHRDATRWAQLYRLLWRITHGQPRLLLDEADDDVVRARRMEAQVMRDAHKMKASVRFRQIEGGDEPWCVAWHRPDHAIVKLVTPFFAERFAAMKWTIITPDESASWDGTRIMFHAGIQRVATPSPRKLADIWHAHYEAAICPTRACGSTAIANWQFARQLSECAVS